MWERLEPRLRDLARRAGWEGAPPAAVAAACALAAVACAWAAWRWWPRDAGEPAAGAAPPVESASSGQQRGTEDSQDASAAAQAPGVFVHVVGAVRRPGVFELPFGARVADAVDAAGGMLPDAVAAGVNLARHVSDGEQVVVPDEDSLPSAGAGAAAGSAAASGGYGAGGAAGPVDVNSADAALLDTLPGIGPSTAAKIIAEREASGPFASLEDLSRVSGIGPKKIEQLDGLACVR